MTDAAEWLETDGLGGYAMGRADGVRTRRYHALLVRAVRPPTGRLVLVSGFDAWVEGGTDRVAISSQRYAPDVTHPDGAARMTAFTHEPWPTWTYRLPDGAEVVQELVMPRGSSTVALSWTLSAGAATTPTRLVVRPFLACRDAHGEQHQHDGFALDARVFGDAVVWHPLDGLEVVARASGPYTHEPLWYRNFQYDEERARGLAFTEDLASPGTFTFDLSRPAVLVFGDAPDETARRAWTRISTAERVRRASFPSALHRSADAYVVARGAGKTIVAGYPWFSDWGRDTFIAMRGLCVAARRLADARAVLLEWSRYVSDGMLPNYFPDGERPPEYNSVDASLWFCVAVHDYLRVAGSSGALTGEARDALLDAVEAIVTGYARGTRYGIRADERGLLSAGERGVQLTWMDARVDGREVTSRVGKPVEIQALWVNALRVAAGRDARWDRLADAACRAFAERFWDETRGALFDVVDVDHIPGTHDARCRPNQILAMGGLPWALLDGDRARRVVDVVERELWTPAGLRTLAPGEPGYVGHYGGDMRGRDAAYHQGTVWPWLAGPFIDAWVRVRGGGADVRRAARERFLLPLLAHWERAAPGHVGEVADGDAPHTPGGCPFQAWSVGEALRAATQILVD